MVEDIRKVEDMELIIDWDLKHQMGFVFEIDTHIVRSIIPREARLQPYEARPGVSLMFLGYNEYNPGNIIYGEKQPAFIEITRAFMIQPNLAVNMPLPRFTFYLHRIASNNDLFVKQEIEKLHLESYYSPSMTAQTTAEKTDVTITDKEGIIRQFLNTNPNVTYHDDTFFGQYYVIQNQKLYFGVWYWAGKVCAHQKPGNAGGIFDHPFLTGLDRTFAPSDVKDCYLQLITRYDAPVVQRFYQPRLVRDL